MSEATFDVYAAALERFEADDALRAVEVVISLNRYWPTIAELVERIGEVSGNRIPNYGEAREHITALAFAQGEKPELHPLERRALNLMGGVYELRHTDKPSIWWSQFRDIYVDLRSVAIREQLLEDQLLALTR